jgi:hypothetical protein
MLMPAKGETPLVALLDDAKRCGLFYPHYANPMIHGRRFVFSKAPIRFRHLGEV